MQCYYVNEQRAGIEVGTGSKRVWENLDAFQNLMASTYLDASNQKKLEVDASQ